ncbi:MAG: ion transporter [Pirellulales bacterium]|nr:ion transporter [Pirellulales bacterium]
MAVRLPHHRNRESGPTNGRAWQRRLNQFFAKPMTELVIGGMIIVSVVLTIVELQSPEGSRKKDALYDLNYLVTCLFAVELSLRFAAASNKRRFFINFWVDLLSLLPLFSGFRYARFLRLFRLLRVLRLLGMFSRYASSFPYIFRRGAVEYVIVTGLILLTVLVCTGAILALDSENENLDEFHEAAWYSIYTLLAGEPIPETPFRSLGGHLVTLGVMFMGMTIFAMFTGTVSAFMVDRLHREGRTVQWDDFHDHTIICGWNRKAEIIVREHLTANQIDTTPIIVIVEFDEEPDFSDLSLKKHVQFLNEDFTKVSALETAGIHRAKACIILADLSRMRNEQDADARTILASLTVEKLNRNVYTCAELCNSEYGTHLEMGHVNDFVVTGEQSGFLLAQAALNRGLMGVFNELLTHTHGNQFYRLAVTAEIAGKSFLDAFVQLKEKHNAILIAVHDKDNRFHINPQDYKLSEGESIIVIAQQACDL